MAEIRSLVEADSAVTKSLLAALVRLLLGVWSRVDPYSPEQVEVAAMKSADLVLRATRQARLATRAYNKRVLEWLGEEAPEPDRDDLDDYPRFDVTPEQVWERPAEAYRYARSQGKSPEQAREALEKKVESLARDDVALAKRDQAAREMGRAERVTGYRRVIHPELSTSGTCGLCVAAATRIYSKADLMPIHPGCNCTVAPITASADPGLQLNDADLAELYKAAGSTGAQDLSNVRLKEVVDGELGPMLTSYGKAIPEGQTRARRTKRTADVVDLDSRRSPKKAADRVASLEAALRGYRKALEGMTGNDELTRYRRTFMERSVKRTEQALKQMRKAAS